MVIRVGQEMGSSWARAAGRHERRSRRDTRRRARGARDGAGRHSKASESRCSTRDDMDRGGGHTGKDPLVEPEGEIGYSRWDQEDLSRMRSMRQDGQRRWGAGGCKRQSYCGLEVSCATRQALALHQMGSLHRAEYSIEVSWQPPFQARDADPAPSDDSVHASPNDRDVATLERICYDKAQLRVTIQCCGHG